MELCKALSTHYATSHINQPFLREVWGGGQAWVAQYLCQRPRLAMGFLGHIDGAAVTRDCLPRIIFTD